MQLIPTTATAVEKIKSSAKAIKKAERLPHMEALERAARIFGYESWYHVGFCLEHQGIGATPIELVRENPLLSRVAEYKDYMDYLSDNGSVTIPTPQTKRIRSHIFSDLVIDDMRFQGFVGFSGPGIISISAFTPEGGSYVPLGCAEIHFCSPWQSASEPAWWICKYGRDEPRINIDSLTEKGRFSLAYEFGIPIYPPSEVGSKEEATFRSQLISKMRFIFYLSPSFKKLFLWAQSHARKVRSRDVRETYLPGWKDAALKGVSPNASRMVVELLQSVALDKENSVQ